MENAPLHPNRKTVEGIIERCGPDLAGHGDHGFDILLEGSTQIYWLPPARVAYARVYGRAPAENGAFVSLTRPGDHVSFDVDNMGRKVKEASFRNWTLEHRLLGSPMKDIASDGPLVLDRGNTLALGG